MAWKKGRQMGRYRRGYGLWTCPLHYSNSNFGFRYLDVWITLGVVWGSAQNTAHTKHLSSELQLRSYFTWEPHLLIMQLGLHWAGALSLFDATSDDLGQDGGRGGGTNIWYIGFGIWLVLWSLILIHPLMVYNYMYELVVIDGFKWSYVASFYLDRCWLNPL